MEGPREACRARGPWAGSGECLQRQGPVGLQGGGGDQGPVSATWGLRPVAEDALRVHCVQTSLTGGAAVASF